MISRPILAAWALLVAIGCGGGSASRPEVVAYVALDQEFAEPVLDDSARKVGVEVRPKFDIESTKSFGLTARIIAEADRPRADLFWNNEILNTLRLKRLGLLAPFDPPGAKAIPEAFRDRDKTWYGFAARARILLVNTRLVALADRPSGLGDLVKPQWKGKVGLAKPMFGTTATHAACLFVAWGDDRAKAYFRGLKANGARVLSGNKQVAVAVGSGALAVGLTDTDDALGEIAAGSPVAIIYPDRRPGELGTLFIPNTLALVRGAPHRESAVALAAQLLGPEAERALARGPSGQIPLRLDVEADPRVETPRTVTPMAADFEAAAQAWDRVASFLADEFAS